MSSAMCGTMETGFFSDPAPCMSRSTLKITSNFFCNWSCPLQHHQSYEEEDTRRSTPTIAPASERRQISSQAFETRACPKTQTCMQASTFSVGESKTRAPLPSPRSTFVESMSKACRKQATHLNLFRVSHCGSLQLAMRSLQLCYTLLNCIPAPNLQEQGCENTVVCIGIRNLWGRFR